MEDSRASVRRLGEEKPKMGAVCNGLQERDMPGKDEKCVCV